MKYRAVLVCLFASALTAFAQGDRGTITGVISDPAGSVVAGAAVEAKNSGTGVTFQAASTATGNYTLAQLPLGTYEINVSVAGFKKYTRTGLTVQALQTVRVDISLEIGASTESVTVTEASPLLKTETGDVSHNVTSNKVDDLPVSSAAAGIRNPLTVSQLIPGTNVVGASTLRISGTPVNSEQVRIDGLDATYSMGMSTYSFGQPSVDAIQEIAVQTSNFAAEYGQAGGAVFNFTMKSGTNQLHGSAYEYWVNEDLNAAGAYSHTDPKSRRNDFGGTLGGPIWIPKVYNGKDKTFFFFSYESSPTTTVTSNALNTVPTLAYRMGDFSAAIAAAGNKVLGTDPLGRPIIQNAIYDPSTTRPVSATDSRLIRDPYPNNMIPANQLDPVALRIQALIPLPQGPNASQLINNYVNPFLAKTKSYIPSIKIDHSLSSKAKLSGFWGWTHNNNPQASAEGLPEPISDTSPTVFDTVNYRLNFDYSVTPTMLLHLGGAYQTSALDMPSEVTGYNVTTQLGLTGPFTPLAFPVIQGGANYSPGVNGLTAAGLLGPNNTGGLGTPGSFGTGAGIGPTAFGGTVDTREEKTTFVASLTWIRDNHSFKFGGETRIEGYPNSNIINTNGSYNFGLAETGLPYLNAAAPPGASGTIGLPYASFLLGLVNNYNIAEPAIGKLGKHSLGVYAQDSWKVTRKFTLEYGLRYDYSTYQKEQYGRFGSFSPTVPNTQDGGYPGGVVYEATCGCNFASNYPFAFGPRLGFAYQLTPKTVIRGGAGILYNGTPNNNVLTRQVTSRNIVSSSSPGQPVMKLSTGVPLTAAQIAYPNFNPSYFPVVTIPGTPGTAPMYQIDPNAGRPSRSYQWSIGVQREIVRDIVVDVSYVGNRGIWWPTSTPVNYNALTPQALLADGIDVTTAAGQAILNAPIGSAAAGPFQNKLPYPNFPLTSTVAQSLRPYPQFTTSPSALWAPLGDTWYNSLQLKVTKRFSHGLDFSYNFTWAQELTNGVEADSVGPFGAAGQENDVFNRAQNKYLSGYSRPLVSNINFTYTVPKFGSNKYLKNILGDWQAGALLTYASGMPILVPTATNNLNSVLFRSTYMNRVPGVPLYTVDINCHCYDPTKTLVLNPAAWVNPPAGQFGTSTAYYNDYRTQRHPVENFNVGRNFVIKERYNFSIRGEFINVFNRTVLPNPSATTPLTAATCFVSGVSGTTGACPAGGGATYASGFGFDQTANITGGTRTGQIVARFRF